MRKWGAWGRADVQITVGTGEGHLNLETQQDPCLAASPVPGTQIRPWACREGQCTTLPKGHMLLETSAGHGNREGSPTLLCICPALLCKGPSTCWGDVPPMTVSHVPAGPCHLLGPTHAL